MKIDKLIIRIYQIIILSLILAVSISVLAIQTGNAATTIEVNSFADEAKNDGSCTLREAIIAANKDSASGKKRGECAAGNGADTIILPVGVYTLTKSDSGSEDSGSTGDLDITSDITIIGDGAEVSTVKAEIGFNDRIFHILSGNLIISNLTIESGHVKDDGGAVLNLGSLTLSEINILNSVADNTGGAIYNAGSLDISASTISSNLAGISGGAIYNAGNANLTNTTISGNSINATSSSNSGGLHNAAGTMSLTNVTISNNSGNLEITGGSISTINSLFANPLDGINCIGTLTSLGYNLSSDLSCADGLDHEKDLNNLDPMLGLLRDNGGETLTLALTSGSPAIDAGLDLEYPLTDQRGITRPFGDAYDIGAYESTTSGNVSWMNAQEITPDDTPLEVYVDKPGLSRWFRFEVHPGQQILITLTDLPGNYDLTLYKDIAQAYMDITYPEDLPKLDIEFAPDAFSPDAFSPDAFSPDAFSPDAFSPDAFSPDAFSPDAFSPDAFSPDAFSPDAFSPDAFSPDAFSPDAFSPDAFSPDAFSPDAFSPDAFSPDAFSPDAFSPDAFSPDAFSPDAFSPDAFSPDAFSPDAFSPDAFSSAQTRSLIAVSAFEGNANEGILVNTWDNTGYFYIRVRGRNGLAVEDGFAIMTLAKEIGQCEAVSADNLPDSSLLPITPNSGNNYNTIILWDSTRLIGANEQAPTQAEINNLHTKLEEFAALPSVNGVVVDVSVDTRVVEANLQADANVACPYAKNLVAGAIEDIIDGYWEHYPLEYVVLVGNDDAIPFFREPDHAMLANEKNYVPPVRDSTSSQASLKLGFVLSQDRYGSAYEVSMKESELPIPALATGRLVETTSEIIGMLDAYSETNNGVVNTPASTLVTGYDFLSDSSEAIRDELNAGTGILADELISPRDLAPADSWTADELKSLLLGNQDGHDLIYLAGHFSANSALAADYVSRLLTTDLLSSGVDLENSIIFSAGCHSGYNIVDTHDVPGVTRAPDWAQAFAQRKATLIAGTGYQYGDTDFIEYSERLYLNFSHELRVGSGPVPIGKALVEAKQAYLADTPQMRGIHEKAYLEATLFGLPMLSVDLPQGRITDPVNPSEISQTTQFTTNPGLTLGLEYADLSVTPSLTLNTRTLTETKVVNNVVETTTYDAVYYSGTDGVVANPVEPVLPLESYNVTVPGFLARGVGFRGGSYIDNSNVIPLTGAATTEVRGVHTPFLTDIFFPVRFWGLNYFDNLAAGGAGITSLNITPAQFISDSNEITKGTLRGYTDLDFRLYYSNNYATYQDGSVPALSAPPSIANIISTINGDQVDFQITVLGNPAAGIQEVWVTYTATSGSLYGTWQSLDLVQNPDNSLIWEGSLSLGTTNAKDVRFMVQAVNGVGMVSASTNLGLSYVPGVDPANKEPTSLTLDVSEPSAPYGTKPTFSATLVYTDEIGLPQPLADARVLFRLGAQTRLAITNSSGEARVEFPILGLPDDPIDLDDDYELKASFPGDAMYASSTTSINFHISKQTTNLTLDPNPALSSASEGSNMVATLTDTGDNPRFLAEKTVFFILTNTDSGEIYEEAVITDYAGRANLGDLSLQSGSYIVDVYFSGTIHLQDGDITLNDDRYEPTSTQGILTLNEIPIADDDFGAPYTLNEDTNLIITAPGILGNDSDPDAYPNPLTITWFTTPDEGDLALNSDGSLVYTPSADFNGQISFTYKASDGLQESNTATVTIEVVPVNDPPVAEDDIYSVLEDEVLVVAAPGVLNNDTDIEGTTLSATIIGQPQHGKLSLSSDGSFTYTPDENYSGNDTFTYTANDGEVDSNTATVLISVEPVNDAPSAMDDVYSTDEDTTLIIYAPGILTNDSDQEGDPIYATLSAGPNHGTLVLNPDGSFSYTPSANFTGSDSFTYLANDGLAASNLATVNIIVNSVNDPPICSDAFSSVNNLWPPNGDFYPVYVLGITDPENDPITVTILSIFQDEEVGNQPDGRILNGYAEVRAERDGNGNGRVYHITFMADDGNGGTCIGEILVAVIPHDQSGDLSAIDDGPLYDSTTPQ